jgi:3-phytase
MTKHLKIAPKIAVFGLFGIIFLLHSCWPGADRSAQVGEIIEPFLVTERLPHDTDDPAIWIDSLHPGQSLIIGTDKDAAGGLYVFDLLGKIDTQRSVAGLKRPNNVDVEYGLLLGGKKTDIAVVTERLTHKLRVYSLPDFRAIDQGGIEVFEGETGDGYRDLMGIALYRDPNGIVYAIVGRKTGPQDGTYLWQYRLDDNGKGAVSARLVRKFGQYSGRNEIESIMVDDKLGYVYYSDEGVGVRKYFADSANGNEELALFGKEGFSVDHEGISLYETSDSTGFILVSDQGSNRFHIFPREGVAANKNMHPDIRVVQVQAKESDGSDITSFPLGASYPRGLFVVMSTDRTFHYYLPEKIFGDSLLNIRAAPQRMP